MNSELKKVYILVKTYPTPSTKYIETVCTAGITDQGEWIRLYPVSYRYLNQEQRYPKYSWIEVKVTKAKQDTRKESYNPIAESIKILSSLPNKVNWQERKRIIVPLLNESLCIFQEKKDDSLGLFKPKDIIDFYWTPEDGEWTKQQQEILNQTVLFGDNPKDLEKMPYAFHYKFLCNDPQCNGHDLTITDWEIYQTYRRWRWIYPDDYLERIKAQWTDKMFAPTRDTYFVIGTTYPYKTPIILSVFWPPK